MDISKDEVKSLLALLTDLNTEEHLLGRVMMGRMPRWRHEDYISLINKLVVSQSEILNEKYRNFDEILAERGLKDKERLKNG